ncbi:shikimate kinase [Scatolibacter rhodanostii]|uniref:shikimate kinase n=1 Tax=Scatolibacter rhodanostii TaxID=2014781 RepID=UPI000C086042|nr:shikimate kinase [Scatolibacter rhodanostii]
MSKNIVLCGFMGCGKTSIGKLLAKQTKMNFCDTDIYLEKKYRMKITAIFKQLGEQRFREMEAEVVSEISAKKNMVIACGGGTVLRAENVQIFQESGAIILFLDVPLEVLQERLKNDKKRPLLQKPNRKEIIAALYEERINQYKKAANQNIDASLPADLLAKKIIEDFEL